ncbi:MAG: hypothetical protein AAB353_08475 [Candidatus Hydrogenedentota bacterium]
MKNLLNYWTLRSGEVVVYSRDEAFVISGNANEVTQTVREMARKIREEGLKALD